MNTTSAQSAQAQEKYAVRDFILKGSQLMNPIELKKMLKTLKPSGWDTGVFSEINLDVQQKNVSYLQHQLFPQWRNLQGGTQHQSPRQRCLL